VRNNVDARLLFVYFIGDKTRDGIFCPQNQAGWEQALMDQASWLGLTSEHVLSNRIYKLFVPTIIS
jgi:hypothetical protein